MAKELKWGKGRQATKLPSQKGVRCQCQCQAHKGTHYGHLTARYAAKGKRTKPSGKEGWPLAAYAQYFVQTCSTEVVSGDRGMCGVRGEGRGTRAVGGQICNVSYSCPIWLLIRSVAHKSNGSQKAFVHFPH